MSRNDERMQSLIQVIEKEKIELISIKKEFHVEWYGLYVRTKELGAGIAIKDGLPEDLKAWVIGHELGHHFNSDQFQLFSPFEIKASKGRSPKSSEEKANRWALSHLTDPKDWIEAEEKYPTSLQLISRTLELPMQAGVSWERMRRSEYTQNETAYVTLSDQLWQEIERRIVGIGGAQALFQRLSGNRKGRTALISRNDFSLIRERAATMRGGFSGTYRKFSSELETAVRFHGGINRFFNSNSI